MNDQQRSQDRKSVALLVQLKHADVGTFAEQWATNLSPGGMFIRTRTPQAIGTLLRFEVKIAGGVRVMRGQAEVRWVREANDPAGPPGMGVRFTTMDPATRELVDRMLAGPERRPSAAAARSSAAELEAELLARLAHAGVDSPPPALASLAGAPSIAPLTAIAPPSPVAPLVPPPAANRAPLPALVAPLVAPLVPPLVAGHGGPLPFELGEAPPEPASDMVDVPLQDLFGDLAEPEPAGTPWATEDELRGSDGVDSTFKDTHVNYRRAVVPPSEPLADEGSFDVSLDGMADIDSLLGAPAPAADPFTFDGDPVFGELGEFGEPAETAAADEFDLQLEDVPAGVLTPVVAASDLAHPAPGARTPVVDGFELLESSPATPVPSLASFEMEDLELELEEPSARAPASAPAPAPARASAPAPARASAPAPAPAPAPAARAPAAPAPLASPVAPAQRPPQPPPAEVGPPPLPVRPKPVFLEAPESLPTTGPVLGIDLGTTNSCVAFTRDGKPAVLRSKDGYNTVPSVVSLSDKGKLTVGHRARSQLVLHPQHTIQGAKRLVGRRYDSAVVQQVRDHYHYEVCADGRGGAAVRLRGQVLALEEVQGLVLRECKQMAEQQLGEPVHRAVVTVPAYYSERQREAVRESGRMAGLRIERVLNEPTAAALAYGLNRQLTRRVLVYDLGGGTFDATVLKVESNVFEVLSTGGDTFLGGVDFDNALVDHLLQRFEQQEGLTFTGDGVALARVAEAAEQAKMALSERADFEIDLPMLMMDGSGKPREMRLTLTRPELDEVCRPMIERTLDVVRDVLLDAKLKASEVEDVILVGGQSRMPLVRDSLKAMFGKAPHAAVNADEAVALGAALYAGTLEKVSNVVLIDVLPMTVGLGLPGGRFQRLLERNTPLPTQRTFLVATGKDGEAALELNLFQGEDAQVGSNEYLGTVRIEDLPKGKKGQIQVSVTLRLDTECVLHVDARLANGPQQPLKVGLAARYDAEQLQRVLGYGAEASRMSEARAEELDARAGGFWNRLKKALGGRAKSA